MLSCIVGVHSYEKNINDKGFQFCLKCGKARHIITGCSHKWIQVFFYNPKDFWGNIVGTVSVMECSKCGEIISKKV